jgi:DNA-binding IclR family transcriptional regulator
MAIDKQTVPGSRTTAVKAAKPKSEVPSVEKALDVLELLSQSPRGLTMNEIIAALGRTMGEVYRIVVYLAKRGYVAQNPDTDRWDLTLKLFELSHDHNPTNHLLKHAVPILERTSFRTDQSCHMAVLSDTSVLVIASVPSPRPAGYSVRTGAMFPLMNTSSGVVLLTYLAPNRQSRLLASFRPADQEILRQRIGKITGCGFERLQSVMVHGVENLCAPVFDRDGVVASLTVGYLDQIDQRSGPDDALHEVITAANDLTQALGGRHPSKPLTFGQGDDDPDAAS